MNTLAYLDDSSKESFTLVLFEWDGGHVAYSNAQDTITYSSVSYTPTPALEVELPPNSGALDTEPCKIQVPTILSGFVDEISTGMPYARTEVTVTEYVRNFERSAYHAQVLYKGLVTRARRYPGGKVGVVEIQAKEPKALMEKRPAGAIASDQCCWQFGKAGCEATVTEYTCYLRSVTRNVAVVYGIGKNSTVAALLANGLIRKDGLAILIRSTALSADPSDAYDLTLNVEPPASWEDDDQVTLRVGCNRSITDCRAHGNESNFGGFGIAIPAYKPTVETR